MRRFSFGLALLVLSALWLMVAAGCSGSSAASTNEGPTTPGPGSNPTAQLARVEGNVVQEGAFVADAAIVAFNLQNGLELDRTFSDAQGHYVLDLPAAQVGIWVAGPAGSAGPEWINVATTLQTSLLDFALSPGAPGLLVGQVRDSDAGTPVGNAAVTFGAQTVYTDGFGFYTLTGVGVPEGTIGVSGATIQSVSEDLRSGQLDRTELFATKFFTVRPTATIGSSLGGVLRDLEDEAALGGAIITLTKPSDPAFPALKAQTNLGGTWRFYNLATGTYRVEVRRAGYQDNITQAVLGEREGVLNLFMTRDAETRADVTGFVFDVDGATPLADVQVVATSGIFGTVVATTTVVGTYELAELVVGVPYTFVVRPPSNGAGGADNQSQTVVLTVPSEGLLLDFVLPLAETGGISGHVTKAGATTPPVGAVVSAEKVGAPGSGEIFRTYVDVNGNYGLNGLPAGSYIIRATYDGPSGLEEFAQTGSTDVIAGEVTTRNIAFP